MTPLTQEQIDKLLLKYHVYHENKWGHPDIPTECLGTLLESYLRHNPKPTDKQSSEGQ